MTSYCLLVALVTLLQKGVCTAALGTIDNCSHQSCPEYKPFCTPIGCMASCPANGFVNGSMCVTSCDHMFVGKNRQCLDDCPLDHLIKEEPVNNADNYRLDRYCVDSCDQVIYNRTCFPVCPIHAVYVNDGHCVIKCPPDKNIVRRFPEDKGHLRCSKDCGEGVFQDNVCVANCTSYRYVFNQTCVKECPKEAPLLFSDDGRETCRTECQSVGKYNQNGTCVTCCSEHELVYNNSCVSVCPDDEPFIANLRQYCPSQSSYPRVDRVCVQKCQDGMFVIGTHCVRECPRNTTTVLEQVCNAPCSEEYPIAVQRQFLYWPHKKYFNCESRCPEAEQCLCLPDRPFLFNGSCISKCPPDAIFAKQRTFTRECVHVCDADEFVFGNTCLKTCPVPKYRYNNSCFDHCPTRYALDLHTAQAGHDMCVDVCDGYIFNNTNCVTSCPNGHQYTYNKTCLESCGTRYVDTSSLTCYDQCPSDRYLFNSSECVSRCPKSQRNIYNRTCTDVCPSEAPFVKSYVVRGTTYPYRSFSKTECLVSCPENTFIYNSQTCEDQCHGFVFKSNCVDVCPKEAPFVMKGIHEQLDHIFKQNTKTECLKECPEDTFINNSNTCVQLCHSFVFKSSCVDECPPEARLTTNEILYIRCLEKCPSGEVNMNGTCIYHFGCKNPNVIFKDECLVECPEHYVWIGSCTPTIVFCILTALCWTALLALIMKQRNQSRNLIQLIRFSFYYKMTKSFDDPRFRNASDRRQTQESRGNLNENDDDVPLLQFDDTARHTENVDELPGIEEVCIEGLNTCDDEPLLQLGEASDKQVQQRGSGVVKCEEVGNDDQIVIRESFERIDDDCRLVQFGETNIHVENEHEMSNM